MKPIQTALSTLQPGSLATERPLDRELVMALFERLAGQLGAKMAAMWAGVAPETVHAEWAAALAGFHPTEIARGLAATATREFAPTLGEFTRLCRPALNPEFAFLEAQHGLADRSKGQRGEWSHPAVFRAACRMSQEVRSGTYRQHRVGWTYTLQRELARGWIEDVPPVFTTRIAHEEKFDPAVRAQALAKIRELIRRPPQ